MEKFFAFVKVFLPNRDTGRFYDSYIHGRLSLCQFGLKPVVFVKKDATMLFAACIPQGQQVQLFQGDCVYMEDRALLQFESEDYAAGFKDTIYALLRYLVEVAGSETTSERLEERKVLLLSDKQRPLPLARTGIFELVYKKKELITARQAIRTVECHRDAEINLLYLSLGEIYKMLYEYRIGDAELLLLCGKLFEIICEPQTMIQIRAARILLFVLGNRPALFSQAVTASNGLSALNEGLASAYRVERQTGKVYLNGELLNCVLLLLCSIFAVSDPQEGAGVPPGLSALADQIDVGFLLSYTAFQPAMLCERLFDVLVWACGGMNQSQQQVDFGTQTVICDSAALQTKGSCQAETSALTLALLSALARMGFPDAFSRRVDVVRNIFIYVARQAEIEVFSFLSARNCSDSANNGASRSMYGYLEYAIHSRYFALLRSVLDLASSYLYNCFTGSYAAVYQLLTAVFNGSDAISQILKISRLILTSDTFYGLEFSAAPASVAAGLSQQELERHRRFYSALFYSACRFVQSLTTFLQEHSKDFIMHQDLYETVYILLIYIATLFGAQKYGNSVDDAIAGYAVETVAKSLIPSRFFTYLPVSSEFMRIAAQYFAVFTQITSFYDIYRDILLRLTEMLLVCYSGSYTVQILQESRLAQVLSDLAVYKPELTILVDLLTRISLHLQGCAEYLQIAPFLYICATDAEKQFLGVLEYVTKAQKPWSVETSGTISQYVKYVTDLAVAGQRDDLLNHLFQVIKATARLTAVIDISTESLFYLLTRALESKNDDMIRLFYYLVEAQLDFAHNFKALLYFMYDDAKYKNSEVFNGLITASVHSRCRYAAHLILFGIAAFYFDFFNRKIVEFYRLHGIDVLSADFSLAKLGDLENLQLAPSNLLPLLDLDATFYFLQQNFEPETIVLVRLVLHLHAQRVSPMAVEATFCRRLRDLTLENVEKQTDLAPLLLETTFSLSSVVYDVMQPLDSLRLFYNLVSARYVNHYAVCTLLYKLKDEQNYSLQTLELIFEYFPYLNAYAAQLAHDIVQLAFSSAHRADLLPALARRDNFLANFLISQVGVGEKVCLLRDVLEALVNNAGALDTNDSAMLKLLVKSLLLGISNQDALSSFVKDILEFDCGAFKSNYEANAMDAAYGFSVDFHFVFEQFLCALTLMLKYREFHPYFATLCAKFSLLRLAYAMLVYTSPARSPVLLSAALHLVPPSVYPCFRRFYEASANADMPVFEAALHYFLIQALQVGQMKPFLESFCDAQFFNFAYQHYLEVFKALDESSQIDASNFLLVAVYISEVTKENYIANCLDNASEAVITAVSILAAASSTPRMYPWKIAALSNKSADDSVRFVRHISEIFHVVSQTARHKDKICYSQNFILAIGKCLAAGPAVFETTVLTEKVFAQILENVVCQQTIGLIIGPQERGEIPIIKAIIVYFYHPFQGDTARILLRVLAKILYSCQRDVVRSVRQHGQELYNCLKSVNISEAAKIIELLE